MALLYPDILENNNTNFPLVNATSLKGTAYPLASINNTGSIPSDKRNVGTIVFDSGSGKFYGFKGSSVSTWNTPSNWIEFGSGTGGSTDLTPLNNFTASMYVTSSQLVWSFAETSPWTLTRYWWDGSIGGTSLMSQTRDIVHAFTASASTRLGSLEAATGSYVTNAKTGSFLYSGSYDSTTSALTLYSKTTNYTLDLSGLAGGGGGGFAITASNEGTVLTENARTFDFVGNAVTATNVGSAVTVTINTGSASTTDITDLNNFTGSAQTSITGLNTFSGSAQTSITGLNTFSGSANIRLDSLEAATSSYVTNAKTGSFYYSSSVSSNVITFNQGDGTTESITIESVPSASFAPNIYNSNGTLPEGTRRVIFADSSILRFDLSSSIAGSPRIVYDTNTVTSGVRFAGTGYVYLDTSTVTMANIPNTVQSNILGRDNTGGITYFSTSSIPNLYNSNGTLTGDRTVTLGANNELRIAPGTGASEFRVSDGPKGGPFSYEFAVSGSGELRVNSQASASFTADIFVTSGKVLTLQPTAILPVGAPVGSFAVSASIPPRPYMWDGTTWYAL